MIHPKNLANIWPFFPSVFVLKICLVHIHVCYMQRLWAFSAWLCVHVISSCVCLLYRHANVRKRNRLFAKLRLKR